MITRKDHFTRRLLENELISDEQFSQINAYRSRGIFSLHNELLFLLYLSVLLFTSGVGTLIYKNIESIGHAVILSLLLILTIACFYFCYRKSKGFSRDETQFENPVYDYLVLLSTILSCTFIGYLQFQYNVFGSEYGIASLICAFIGFAAAYYFDNKSALSVGITALATAIGIVITPTTLLFNKAYTSSTLIWYGLVLGLLLEVWTVYSDRIGLKKHFGFIFHTFALHLMAASCIAGLFKDFWFVFPVILAAVGYYFYKKSYEIRSVSIFVFTLIYCYVGLNISLGRLLSNLEINDLFFFIAYLSPFYVVGSIFYFIKLVKQFNKETDESIQ